MSDKELEKFNAVLNAIGLNKMQDVDDYILTITSSGSKSTISQNFCMTRCFLLYMLKNKAFKYEIDNNNDRNINVYITVEQIHSTYEVLQLSHELRDFIISSSRNGMVIVSKNREALLKLIS